MQGYDVIIIGAGPAGLNCARALSKSNLKILLIEKNKEIGPKVCAGGLTGKDLKHLNLPDNLIEFKFNQIKIHVNKSASIIKNNDYFVYTIDRKRLGQWQLKQLKHHSNVTIRTKAFVSEIDKKYIIVNNKKIKYRILVGADGSASVVRKYLGIKNREIGLAIQHIIPTKRYRELEFFLDSKLFSSWYAWIFPHKNYVSIGCGCNPKKLSLKRLRNNFSIWLKENRINVSKARFESFPINYDYRGYRFNNIYLIGDAAGFASGLTGEGIYQALITGEEVGKIILNKNFVAKNIFELLETKRKHNRLMNNPTASGWGINLENFSSYYSYLSYLAC